MKTVTLSYNPYSQAAQLWVDASALDSADNRIHTYVTGKPMDCWLEGFVQGYRVWNGLLPELVDDLNDDQLHIVFAGRPQDYQRLCRVLGEQDALLAARGYAGGLWSTEFRERFDSAQTCEQLVALVRKLKPYIATQAELLEADLAQYSLETEGELSPERLLEVGRRLHALVGRLNQRQPNVPQLTWKAFQSEISTILHTEL